MNNPHINFTGDKYWHNAAGLLHRDDGPALESINGSKSWWVNGQYHREDGPAIEWANGGKYWYINGKHLREYEFNTYSESLDNILNIDYG